MDNTRYATVSPSTTQPIAPRSLTNVLMVLAGVGLAVLVLNALRINGVFPDGGILKALAPLGAASGTIVLAMATALLRPATRAGGYAVAISGSLTALAVAGLTTIEVLTNYAFPALDDAGRGAVLSGWVGTYLTVVSLGFIAVTLAFAASLVLTRSAAVWAIGSLAAGAVILGLRTMLPNPLVGLGLVLLGVGAFGLVLAVRRAD